MKKYILYIICLFLNIEAKSDENLNKLTSLNDNIKRLNNFLNIEKIIQNLENEQVDLIIFVFLDILGNLKEIKIPISKARNAFVNGLTFDSSSIDGYSDVENSDMLIMPDYKTLRFLPWIEGPEKTAWFICNVYKDSKNVLEYDPRFILENSLKELNNLNYKFNVGVELEFFIFKDGKPIDNLGYFDVEKQCLRQEENDFLIQALEAFDVDVEKFHHEVAPGQYEISLAYGNALKIADQVIAAKYIIEVILNDCDYKVSFMPKPIYEENGSAMHIHYSLYNKSQRKNCFYSEYDQYNLSDLAKKFLAGNMKYIKEFSAILNPSINSYKRLVKDFEAPIYNFWGLKNRSALFRIPLLNQNACDSMRIEIRNPDCTANPYLAFASILKTGLNGIKENLVLEDPISLNVFKLAEKDLKDLALERLPKNLEESLIFLEKSDLAKELFTEQGLNNYINLKNNLVDKFNKEVINNFCN